MSRKIVSSSFEKIIKGLKCATIYHRNSQDDDKLKMLQEDILNVPYHVFGSHSKCAQYFCIGVDTDGKNYIEKLETDGVLECVKLYLNRMKQNAQSLLYGYDSNICEQFNSVLCQYVGGKRINYSLGQSYSNRCALATVQFNSKRAFTEYVKTRSHSANTPTKKILVRSETKRRNELHKRKLLRSIKKTTSKKRKRKAPADRNYGNVDVDDLQVSDLSPEAMEKRKKEFQERLGKNYRLRSEIEEQTRDQANCEKWHELRKEMVTASNFGRICKVRTPASYHNIVKVSLYGLFSSSSVAWGKENEKKAIEKLEQQAGIHVEKCGFVIDSKIHFLGATPDGLVGNSAICEVKCPSSAKAMSIEEAVKLKKITYLQKQGNKWELKKTHEYHYQVQGQLHITGREKCYFGVWTTCDFTWTTIKKDDTFWQEKMKEKLISYYENHLLLELCDPRIPRNMRVWNTQDELKN